MNIFLRSPIFKTPKGPMRISCKSFTTIFIHTFIRDSLQQSKTESSRLD